ncbi:MAG: hypothetical protein R6X20_18705 [Phycisphaerae bacterium]
MHRAARVSAVLVVCAILVQSAAADDADRIRPWPKNPYYWQYKGRPVLLLGGSVEDNLFQIPNLAEHLDTLAACGGNYVRCTMSWRDEGNVPPFARKGEKFDLGQPNPEFWKRFERFLAETARRDVIVQVEVWATFDYYRDNWDRNPFNPKNNVNYTAETSGLPLAVKTHPTRTENDFFRSAPGAKDLKVVRKYQERFVETLLSHSLPHDHVLYCMDNETSVTPTWGAYWAGFIRTKAKAAGKRVEVTEMWDKWDLAHPQHNATFDHPETYSFVDISQNNHNKGERHYAGALAQRRRIAEAVRPMNNVKIYGADGGKYGATRDAVERFWRNIFAGCASARFHRPASGIGLSARAQRMIRAAREVTGAVPPFACVPRPDLLGDREAGEAFCLTDPGRQYAVYFPRGGKVTLDASAAGGAALSLRWYDIDGGRWRKGQEVTAVGPLVLQAPGKGQWAAVIRGPKGN